MKGSSGYLNPHQASCPANSERAPPSYEEIAGSSTQFGDAGKSLPTQFPPAYTEQEQNVRVVYLPAPNFGPKSAKVICSSCQATVTTSTDSRPSMMAWAVSCALCFTMLWPCFCVPFCIDSFKDVKHSCPNCNATLGRYKGCV